MKLALHTGLGAALLLAGMVQTAAQAAAQAPRAQANPVRPTAPAISVADLRTRLFTFAHDSMQGREAGTPGHDRGTHYLASELRRLGLRPAGENGTFFQAVPLVRRSLDPASSLTVDGNPLTLWTDYVPAGGGNRVRPLNAVQAVYGGVVSDSTTWISREQAVGKLVVFGVRVGTPLTLNAGGAARFADAAGFALVVPDAFVTNYGNFLRRPSITLVPRDVGSASAINLLVPARVGAMLLGMAPDSARPGTLGRTVQGSFSYLQLPAPSRNVVAMLPGSDPALRAQYVAIGAHSDHDGVRPASVITDHDSLRASNALLRPGGANGPPAQPTAEQRTQVRASLDSLRRVHGAPRRDSIFNGADDDGSGSVAVLEIAEMLARAPQKPKRSMLFVWHTAEEKGLLGARHFTDNPTVPRDSIVAQLNIDMIGRGRDEDIPGPQGGPGYLQLIGSKRLSTELGALVETANQARSQPFSFDYQFDAANHPQQYYCRSDHYMYARYGIPVVFFTTGDHRDYHQVTDEPQYIDYEKLANVTRFIADVGLRVANLNHRVVVDQPKPADPNGPCRQ